MQATTTTLAQKQNEKKEPETLGESEFVDYKGILTNLSPKLVEPELALETHEIDIFLSGNSKTPVKTLEKEQEYYFDMPLDKGLIIDLKAYEDEEKLAIFNETQNVEYKITKPLIFTEEFKTGRYKLRTSAKTMLSLYRSNIALEEGDVILNASIEESNMLNYLLAEHAAKNMGNILIISNQQYARKYGFEFANNAFNKEDIKPIEENKIFLDPLFSQSGSLMIARIYHVDSETNVVSTIYGISMNVFKYQNSSRVFASIASTDKYHPLAKQQQEAKRKINFLIVILGLVLVSLFYSLWGEALKNFIKNLNRPEEAFIIIREKLRKLLKEKILPALGCCIVLLLIGFFIIYRIGATILTFYKKSEADIIPGFKIDEFGEYLVGTDFFQYLLIVILAILLLILAMISWAYPQNIKNIIRTFHRVSSTYEKKSGAALLIIIAVISSLYLLYLFFFGKFFSLLSLIALLIIVLLFIYYYSAYIFENSRVHTEPAYFKKIFTLILMTLVITPVISLAADVFNIIFPEKSIISNSEKITLDIGSKYDTSEKEMAYLISSQQAKRIFQKPNIKALLKNENIATIWPILMNYVNIIGNDAASEINAKVGMLENEQYRLFRDEKAFVYIPDARMFENKFVNISARLQSTSSVKVTDLQALKYLLYNPFIKKENVIAQKEGYYILATDSEKKPEIRESTNIYEFFKNNVPKEAAVLIATSNSNSDKIEEIKKISVADYLPEKEQTKTTIHDLNLLNSNYTFYTVLDTKVELSVKLASLKPGYSSSLEILIINPKKGNLVGAEPVAIDGSEFQKTATITEENIEPGIYAIKIINYAEENSYLIDEIKINSEKLVLEGSFKHQGEGRIHFKSIGNQEKIINEDGTADDLDYGFDKASLVLHALTGKNQKLASRNMLIAFSEKAWFNPYPYYFIDNPEKAEYIITDEVHEATSQELWNMVEIKLSADNFIDKQKRMLIEIGNSESSRNSNFFFDQLSISIANP